MKICKNCGVELEDDVLYCPLCGEFSDEGAMGHHEHATRGDGRPHPAHPRPQSASPKRIIALFKRIFHV